jgi:hypothetical protein
LCKFISFDSKVAMKASMMYYKLNQSLLPNYFLEQIKQVLHLKELAGDVVVERGGN